MELRRRFAGQGPFTSSIALAFSILKRKCGISIRSESELPFNGSKLNKQETK